MWRAFRGIGGYCVTVFTAGDAPRDTGAFLLFSRSRKRFVVRVAVNGRAAVFSAARRAAAAIAANHVRARMDDPPCGRAPSGGRAPSCGRPDAAKCARQCLAMDSRVASQTPECDFT